MAHQEQLTDYLQRFPKPEEIRSKLASNLEENRLLRRLLKLAEQRQRVQESSR